MADPFLIQILNDESSDFETILSFFFRMTQTTLIDSVIRKIINFLWLSEFHLVFEDRRYNDESDRLTIWALTLNKSLEVVHPHEILVPLARGLPKIHVRPNRAQIIFLDSTVLSREKNIALRNLETGRLICEIPVPSIPSPQEFDVTYSWFLDENTFALGSYKIVPGESHIKTPKHSFQCLWLFHFETASWSAIETPDDVRSAYAQMLVFGHLNNHFMILNKIKNHGGRGRIQRFIDWTDPSVREWNTMSSSGYTFEFLGVNAVEMTTWKNDLIVIQIALKDQNRKKEFRFVRYDLETGMSTKFDWKSVVEVVSMDKVLFAEVNGVFAGLEFSRYRGLKKWIWDEHRGEWDMSQDHSFNWGPNIKNLSVVGSD